MGCVGDCLHFIFAFLAAAALLAGAILNWMAIDEEGSGEYEMFTGTTKYTRMAFRYEAAGVFFIGVMALFQAFFPSKFPGISSMFTYAIVGLGFYSLVLNTAPNGTGAMHFGSEYNMTYRSTTGRFNAVFINELRLFYQANRDIHATTADTEAAVALANTGRYMYNYEKMYLGGGFLVYAGFILAIMSQASNGFWAEGKKCLNVFKVISVLVLTALAIIGIFLIASSNSTNFPWAAGGNMLDPRIPVYMSNVLVVAATFYIWVVAFNALLITNQQLAGATSVLFGIFGFYFLMKLLAVNDQLVLLNTATFLSDKDYKQTRAGYLFCWFTAIFAFLSNISVYAYPANKLA